MIEEIEWPKGIKRTKQREELVHILYYAEQPMNVNDIYNQMIQQTNRAVNAISTIYRMLSTFEEKGYIKKSLLMGDDTAVYEWIHGNHKHYAICLSCHRLIPLKKCPFENLSIATEDETFTITDHKLEIYGYCQQCGNLR